MFSLTWAGRPPPTNVIVRMKTFCWADCGSSSPAGESSAGRIQNQTGSHLRKRQPPQLRTASEAKRLPNPLTIIRGGFSQCQRTTTQLLSALFAFLRRPPLSACRRRCPRSAGGECEVGGEQRSIPPLQLPSAAAARVGSPLAVLPADRKSVV